MNRRIKIFSIFVGLCLALSLIITLILINTDSITSLQIMSHSNYSSNKMNSSYRFFHGFKSKNVNLKQGEELTINYKSEVQSGSLTLKVLDSKGDVIKVFEGNTEGTENLKADTDKKLKIVVEGNKTRGSYEISWVR
jgi:methionine-rich copper-binding protein CopC